MKATDRLRELLDERGVEWQDDSSRYGVLRTVWKNNGVTCVAAEVSGLLRTSGYLTPEQAIAATLGWGTCHMRLAYEEEDEDGFIWPDFYECSGCHARVNGILTNYDTEVAPKVCPNCGRKVVYE